ncbi:MAG: SDR family NAD(P)-dependent oxidoreductase [Patescibacteria group bacterium]|jgi:3-oxoacyl-[acyl-carrier protein] reductase
MKLDKKVAIVTGASSGLGKAMADLFVAEGAQVVYSDIHDTAADVKLEEGRSIYVKCDVSKKEEVDGLIKAATEKFGRLDIMVNNAGVGDAAGLLDTAEETWEKILRINLFGVFYGAQAAANYMKGKGVKGSIINISSILGTVGFSGAISYCAAKGGVVQLTHAGALDIAPLGIRMNAVAPGFIATNMTKGVLENEGFNNLVKANTPLGYVGESKDIAQAALYLASDDSKYVTGTVLHVDGGWTAR